MALYFSIEGKMPAAAVILYLAVLARVLSKEEGEMIVGCRLKRRRSKRRARDWF